MQGSFTIPSDSRAKRRATVFIQKKETDLSAHLTNHLHAQHDRKSETSAHIKVSDQFQEEALLQLTISGNNSGRSINRKIFTLRSYGHFIKLQEVPYSDNLPFYDVLKIREGYRNRPDALTSKQLKGLFDNIDRDTCIGIRDYALYALMYLTGLRVGEVHALNIDSIDLKKIRVLHLTEELFQVISEYLAVRSCFHNSSKTKALFLSKKGNRLAIRTMEDKFKKLVKKSGLKVRFNVTCHTLRHTGVYPPQAGLSLE